MVKRQQPDFGVFYLASTKRLGWKPIFFFFCGQAITVRCFCRFVWGAKAQNNKGNQILYAMANFQVKWNREFLRPCLFQGGENGKFSKEKNGIYSCFFFQTRQPCDPILALFGKRKWNKFLSRMNVPRGTSSCPVVHEKHCWKRETGFWLSFWENVCYTLCQCVETVLGVLEDTGCDIRTCPTPSRNWRIVAVWKKSFADRLLINFCLKKKLLPRKTGQKEPLKLSHTHTHSHSLHLTFTWFNIEISCWSRFCWKRHSDQKSDLSSTRVQHNKIYAWLRKRTFFLVSARGISGKAIPTRVCSLLIPLAIIAPVRRGHELTWK